MSNSGHGNDLKSLEGEKMKTEFLKGLGLEHEVIDKIMAENGRDIEQYKNQVNALTTEKNQLTTQITEANKTIQSFKDIDVDKLKASVTEWEDKYNKAVQDSANEIKQIKFNTSLNEVLRTAKAKNNKAVRALLDESKITLNDDGTFLGLKEQLDSIQKENSYLFDTEEPKVPKVVSGTEGKSNTDKDEDSFIRKVLGLPPKDKE